MPKIAPFAPGSDAFFPGDYFTLQCSIIHGDLPISIYWQFNNQTIETNHEIMISNMGSRSSVLTIESVRDHNAGVYTCFGKNNAGLSSHSVELTVNGLHNFFSYFCFKVYIVINLFTQKPLNAFPIFNTDCGGKPEVKDNCFLVPMDIDYKLPVQFTIVKI